MSDRLILEDEKKYNHEESVKLLEEVRNFFQESLKMIGIELDSGKKSIDSAENIKKDFKKFFIKKGKEPLYKSCNGITNVEKILDKFNKNLENLYDNFESLIDNNQNIDENSKNNINSYLKAIEKGINVFEKQRKRRNAKFKELSTVEELQEELKQFISEIIVNYIILVLVDALYERIKNNSGDIYFLAINEINNFLKENGVYTKEINLGEEIDLEYVEPTQDSSDNLTDDFNKFNTINEIRRYPYLFADGSKLLDGSAKIWRRKD